MTKSRAYWAIVFLLLDLISNISVAVGSTLIYNQTGELPEDIFVQYPNITSLIATNLKLKKIPAVFKSNASNNLEHLDLSHNLLSALKSHTFLNLIKLLTLSLANNQLRKLESSTFKGLDNLQSLDLSFNHLTRIIRDVFEDITNVTNIQLNNNRLSLFDFGLFVKTTKLSKLQLQFNELEEPYITFKYSLEVLELNISNNNLDRLYFLYYFSHLESLDLSNNVNAWVYNLTFDGNESLKDLKLRNMSLHKVVAEIPRIFKHTPNLEQLDMSYNQMKTIDLRLMPSLQKLEKLDLSENDLQEFVVGDLPKRFPNLKNINLDGNKLKQNLDGKNSATVTYINWLILYALLLVDLVWILGEPLSL